MCARIQVHGMVRTHMVYLYVKLALCRDCVGPSMFNQQQHDVFHSGFELHILPVSSSLDGVYVVLSMHSCQLHARS